MLPDAGVSQHVGRRPVGQDPTLVKGDDAPAVALHDVDVVLDEHHRRLPLRESGHDGVHDGELLLAGDAAGGLVEEEQGRLARRGHGDVEQLPHALGHDGRRPIPIGLDPIDPQESLAGRDAVAARQGMEPGPAPAVGQAVSDQQIVEHRHRREDLRHLERATDAEPGDVAWPQADELLAPKADRPRARVRVAGDQVDERRLARAVRADDAHDLLGRDAHVDVPGGHDLIEQLGEPAHLEHRRAGHARTRLRSSADQSPPGK